MLFLKNFCFLSLMLRWFIRPQIANLKTAILRFHPGPSTVSSGCLDDCVEQQQNGSAKAATVTCNE